MPRKRRLHWPPRPAPQQCRRRAPHAWAAMGRGRVDPAPPTPINSDPKGRKKGGENGRKQGRRAEEKKNRDNERVGRKTETERETIVFLREKGEDERKETAGYFLEKRRVKRKGIKGSRKKNRGEQRRKKEEKKEGERGPEQQQRRNRNENRKKETTATFKPRIPAAATAPLSRCHRHLQPRIPAAATALLSSRHRE